MRKCVMSYVFRKNFDENKLPGICAYLYITLYNINLKIKIRTMQWKFNYPKIKARSLAPVSIIRRIVDDQSKSVSCGRRYV